MLMYNSLIYKYEELVLKNNNNKLVVEDIEK